MDSSVAWPFFLWGASWMLYVQGLIQAYNVFNDKKGRVFILVIVGLTSAIIRYCSVMAVLYFEMDQIYHCTIGALAWILMILSSALVYSLRIKSIGGYTKHARYINWAPWLLLIPMIPANILASYGYYHGSEFKEVQMVCALFLGALIAMFEIYLYVVLFLKIWEMLEYRSRVKQRLLIEMSVGLAFLIVLDIVIFFTKLFSWPLDKCLRPFSYIVRLVLVIKFFDILVDEVTKPLELEQMSIENIPHKDVEF